MSKPVIFTHTDRCICCPHCKRTETPERVEYTCKAHAEHVESPMECARDEITEWVASHYAGDNLDEAVQWLLGWANRRAAQVNEHLADSLRNVLGAELATTTWPVQSTLPANIVNDLREQVEMDEATIRSLKVDANAALRWAALPLRKDVGGE